MKFFPFLILFIVINIFTATTYAIDLSCKVTLIDDGKSPYPIAATHRYKNTTDDGKRVVYFRANQANLELYRQQQIYSFSVDNPSQVILVTHDLADNEFIVDYRLQPDNLHIVYQVVDDTFDSQIYVARLDRPETFYVMTVPQSMGWLWTPKFYFNAESESNWIIFHDSKFNLRVYDLNSHQLLKLSDDYTFNYELSPTEPIVYYSDDQDKIYVARLDGTEVTSTGNIGYIYRISEDGNWLLISPPYEIDDPYQIFALNTDFNSEQRLIYESDEFYSDRQFHFVSANEVVITIMDIDERLFKRDLLNLSTGNSIVYNATLPTKNIPNALWQYTSDGKNLIFGSNHGLKIYTVNNVIEPLPNSFPAYNFILDESENFIIYFEENAPNVFTLTSYDIKTRKTTLLYYYDEFEDSPSYVDHHLYFTKDGYVYYTINDNLFRVLIDGSKNPTLIDDFSRPIQIADSKDFVYFADTNNSIVTVSTDKVLQYREVDEGDVLLLYPQSAKDIFYYMNDDNLYASTSTGLTYPLLTNINPNPQAHLLERNFGQDLLVFSDPIDKDITQIYYISCGIR